MPLSKNRSDGCSILRLSTGSTGPNRIRLCELKNGTGTRKGFSTRVYRRDFNGIQRFPFRITATKSIVYRPWQDEIIYTPSSSTSRNSSRYFLLIVLLTSQFNLEAGGGDDSLVFSLVVRDEV